MYIERGKGSTKQSKSKWLFGTIVQQKSPVAYLVKLESRKRLCHVDHLLHSTVTSTNSEADGDHVPDLVLIPAPAEPDALTPTPKFESESTSMSVAVQCSTRETRAPHRLFEEFPYGNN